MGRTAYTEHQCLYKGALYLTFYIVFIFSPTIGLFDPEDGDTMLVRNVDTHLPMDV